MKLFYYRKGLFSLKGFIIFVIIFSVVFSIFSFLLFKTVETISAEKELKSIFDIFPLPYRSLMKKTMIGKSYIVLKHLLILRESNYNGKLINRNFDGTIDYGLNQVNQKTYEWYVSVTGKSGDLLDDNFNQEVSNWFLDYLYSNVSDDPFIVSFFYVFGWNRKYYSKDQLIFNSFSIKGLDSYTGEYKEGYFTGRNFIWKKQYLEKVNH